MSATPEPETTDATGPAAGPPFRFYDNRQKYLAFVNTCNEKAMIARRAAQQLDQIVPRPPALRLFDAGMGDGTVLSRLMSAASRRFPTVPLVAVAKEISLEDIRLGLEKMPDRFYEHPHMVLALTNLNYADAPRLVSSKPGDAELNWQAVKLTGESTYGYLEQIEALGDLLAHGWETKPSPETGNPIYARPTVLVLYREDHEFLLDAAIPHAGDPTLAYDFILASQPWRAKTSAEFKAQKILAPLARTLAPGGAMLTVQSAGRDPSQEIVDRLWPGERPFPVDRHALIKATAVALGDEAASFDLTDPSDADALCGYEMHTLPTEIGDRIGTSTLFAAWNAAIYVNQIEDERLESVVATGAYLEATQDVLKEYGGLWFNDEAFTITRRT
jgi:hypothetical protein